MCHSLPSPHPLSPPRTRRAPTPAAPARNGVTIRRAESHVDYEACVAIQEETWGAGFSERVPASVLLVSQKLSGVVAVACAPGGRVLGFVFGMTGLENGTLIHWSDMLAVRMEAQGTGIGERLKRYQRDLVRALGIRIMRWTFDPLVARNAHLNLVRLGARVTEYVPNMYGSNTGSPLHGVGDTDRVVASWDLAVDSASGIGARASAHRDAVVVNAPDAGGVSRLSGLPDAPTVRIAVPDDVQTMGPELRAEWRAATREAFATYFRRGYIVAGFERGGAGGLPGYLLVAPARTSAVPQPFDP